MAIIPRMYINAVASIGIKNEFGVVSWIGTGFFVRRKIDESHVLPFLVTNKHVVFNLKSIVVRMTDMTTGAIKDVDVLVVDNNSNSLYRQHSDSSIDIAVFPLDGTAITNLNLDFSAFDIDNNALSSKELMENGVYDGSLVYMLGFPMGLVNNGSKEPICRLGCVARIGETQIQETHNILLDIQNFPGNSGSPIVSRPEFIYVEDTPYLNRSVLMGIIHSYIPYQERLINEQTKLVAEIKSENSGIANMHPVEYIRNIIDTIQPKNKII